MKKSTILAAICLTTVSIFYTSCKKKDTTTPTTPVATTPAGPTLYTRVGGTVTVQDPRAAAGTMIETGRLTLRSVVDSAIYVIAGDAQINGYFQVLLAEVGAGNTTGFSALSENFTDFLCTATGATNTAYTYGGRSMKDAHDPMYTNRISNKVTSADFDKFVGDIGTALAKNGVNSTNNAQLVTDLVALLETTKSTIVQR
ncbi:MAG: group 1 truncated hemoglobin [Bacteroidia bacterium]